MNLFSCQANAAIQAPPKGLVASRHAANGTGEDGDDVGNAAGKDEPAAEGEREPDHSSAGLALVRAPLCPPITSGTPSHLHIPTHSRAVLEREEEIRVANRCLIMCS